jgi:D-alanyl-lipoteichoic acid acyltransferase DltB (MBOAT superfamily)
MEDFSYGVKRFIIGLGKKLILANMVAAVADRVFASVSEVGYLSSETPSMLGCWVGIACYTIQIYFDFSGYSDMAIGLSRMFGFRILENFNYPYISGTVTEFWRRWHISLSSWFRDYVYIPLGGSRVSTKGRLVFNLFVTWMLTGVWHGAGWTFVFWGLFYFALLTFEKLCGIPAKVAGSVPFAVVYRIITILCFMSGWVVFRAPSILAAFTYYRIMFGFESTVGVPFATEMAKFYLVDNGILLIICVVACTPLVMKIGERMARTAAGIIVRNTVSTVFLAVLFLSCISFTVSGSYNPFIYFNF